MAPIFGRKTSVGKLFGKGSNNFALLKAELFARLEKDIGRKLTGRKDQADQLAKLITEGREREAIDFPSKDRASVGNIGITTVKEALKYHEEVRCDQISAKYDCRYFEVLGL